MKKRLTIKKIAELSGVSVATVSKVLNNNGRYSEDTKQKVLDIVKENDYRPNAVAKSLRTSKSKTIGVIVPDITNEFFAQVVLSIDNYCASHGYSVFIFNSAEDEEREIQYVKDLEVKGIDGLIALSGSDKLLNYQKDLNIPIVCMDRKPKQQGVAVISSDNYTGGYIATKELIENGCNKILMIRDYRDVMPMVERYNGYVKALEESGLTYNTNYVLKVEIGIEQGKNAIKEVLKKKDLEFDGIFAAVDWLALGAVLALEEEGIRVPEDIKVVGYDNITLAKYNKPSITSINQDKNALGEQAAESLLEMIENEVSAQNVITIPVELVKRQSTGHF